ncbi:MAG: hypothetical protein IJY01_00390 [Clostridia bacterium]|nr:hypothetical protein [Clostridia bacterium]
MNNELEIITPTNKWSERQKKYNNISKNIMGMFGANIALYICILIPVLLVGFIWTDIGAPEFNVGLISDGAVTVTLFIIGEVMMTKVGADGGKLDADYITARNDYKSIIAKVNDLGTMLLRPFCEWQVDIEFEEAITSRLKAARITKDEYLKVRSKSFKELKATYGARRASIIKSVNDLEPIDLNESVLLYDGSTAVTRGGVPMSGDEYLKSKAYTVQMLISTLFTCLVTISFAITFTEDITFARVIYTALKLVVLFFRMAKGYARGAQAYNTVEVRQYQVKTAMLREYVKFVNDKTYLKLGDTYGDLSALISTAPTDTVLPDIMLLRNENTSDECQ